MPGIQRIDKLHFAQARGLLNRQGTAKTNDR